ncbi:MAG: universal stress protein [Nitrospirota bacterium]|nr:universal stress protein [Nitrospirota bacterium]
MIKHILVPSDGSPHGEVALKYATNLARSFSAEIEVLNVTDIRALQGPFLRDLSGALGFISGQDYEPKIEAILRERGAAILRGAEEKCSSEGVSCRGISRMGVVDAIVVEEGKKADLIVMGQRGENAEWGTGLLGSTTEAVVRKSNKPVLVVPSEYREITKPLMAYDGSLESNKALKVAVELAEQLGLPLSILTVTEDEEKGLHILNEAAEFLSGHAIKWSTRQMTGSEEEVILQEAGDGGFDLIIMGAYGHGRIREMILGSTTAYVMRRSEVPLLLTR